MLMNCAENNPGRATAPEKLCRESGGREPERYAKTAEAGSEFWSNAGSRPNGRPGSGD